MKRNTHRRLSKVLVGLIFAATFPALSHAQDPGKSYIMKTEYMDPDDTTVRHQITYFDGLGRPEQTIRVDGGGTDIDIADLTEYDDCGRAWRTWLPAGIPGNARQTVSKQALLQHAAFLYGDGRVWSETEYDGTPLDRVRSQAGPGAAWAQAERRVRTGYLTNGDNDSLRCRRFYPVYPTADTLVTVRCDGVWAPGTLTVERVEDEDGRAALTFTDFLGRTVLTRQVDYAATGTDRYLDTYYVYDEGGRLLAVLPPMLASAISGNGVHDYASDTSAAMRGYGYFYGYDDKGRCIAKRLPGCGWTRFAYDKGDRLVLEEGPEDREAGRIRFVLGDRYGRECLRGIWRTDFDSTATVISSRHVRVARDWPSMRDTCLFGYYPENIALSGVKVLEANYYDDYTFARAVPQDSLFRQMDTAQVLSGVDSAYVSAAGLRTGRLMRVLGLPGHSHELFSQQAWEDPSQVFLWDVTWYDEKGQPVESRRATHVGGMTREMATYRFTGEVETRTLVHYPKSGNPKPETYTYTYSIWGQPLKTWHSWDNGTSVLVSDREYDTGGRLFADSRNGVQALRSRYTYNVRSWLTGMCVGAPDSTDVGGAFTERLYYNALRPASGDNARQWGGNISGMDWQGTGTDTLHRYNYGYDGLSRLVQASYGGPFGADTFSEEYAYDAHGNMTERRDNDGGGDSFQHDGNRLVRVGTLSSGGGSSNNPGDPFGDPSVFNPPSHYELNPRVLVYDVAGRLSYDNNRGVKVIRYNLLGLPSYVLSGHQEHEQTNVLRYNASYGYSADGKKVRRKTWTYRDNGALPSVEHFTDYVRNLVYQDNTLKTVLFEGGFIDATDGSRHFFITDHQGNIRVVTDASGTIEQTNDYTPFGGEFNEIATGVNPGLDHRFGGKEKDASLPSSPIYDFSARVYNTAYARFTTMDPLCEKYYAISPYAYCANNPINMVDPEGKSIRIRRNKTRAIKDLARIAATSRGQDYLKTLIGGDKLGEAFETEYRLEPVSIRNKAGFDGQYIKYLDRPWFSVGGGSKDEFALMGHEIRHAFDYSNHVLIMKKNGESRIGRIPSEENAVTFENYLRSVFGIEKLRTRYSGLTGRSDFNPKTTPYLFEQVRDFRQINEDEDNYRYGYRYISTINGESSTYYLYLGIDNNDFFYFNVFDNEEDYKMATGW